ncbi:hypothetical protein R3P38DRAFT_3078413 [Favolaschia claudopus]|uniref:DUF6532 domain-containing protein n=1 Tax=Favolaschia claudopus TaxID=2862362 RepID=A0AAV9ZVW2_9AGAR
MSTQDNLTTADKRKLAAEKRKATIAARAAQEVEANIAFQNESRANGGREAKKLAKQNAVWNRDQSSGWIQEDSSQTRKRTSSTADATDIPAKKAREFNDGARDNDEDTVASKSSKKNKGKSSVGNLPPPSGADSRDKDAPDASSKPVRRIDFSQVKSSAREGIFQSKGRSDGSKTAAAPKARAKIIADSASEDEAEDSEADSDDSDSTSSNEDGFIDAKEFVDEVPQVILSHDKADKARSAAADPGLLFESEDEEYGIVKVKAKARQPKPIVDDSDDSMSDAPPLRPAVYDDNNIDDGEFIDVDMQPRSRKSSASSHMSAVSAVARMHVESDVDSRGYRSRRSSMGSAGHASSVPPSELESDGFPGADVDEDEEPPKKKKKAKKSKKVSEGRRRQAEAEQPVVRSEGAGTSTLVNTAAPPSAPAAPPAAAPAPANGAAVSSGVAPPTVWHITTIIVLPAPGRDISLTAQPIMLQQVLRGAIFIIKIELLFIDAYPRMTSRAGYARERMIQAAVDIPAAAHILGRLGLDAPYAALLSSIPIDRINILRGNFKRTAVTCVPAFFSLAGLSSEKVKTRVEELLKDHRYIFPPNGERLRLDQPFTQGAISFVIKEEVFSNPAFVTQNLDRFPARSRKHPSERELPDAMVALAATAVYAALVEYRNTGRRQNIPFTEDAYESTYRNHMETLSQTRNTAPNSMHNILHQLFNDVTESDSVAHTTNGSSATLIQLVDVPDSD